MRASCSLQVPTLVARAIGFNRNLTQLTVNGADLDGFATIPISAQSDQGHVPPASHCSAARHSAAALFFGQMNQSKAMCRKLNPLDGLVLKSSRSFNSTKSVELMQIARLARSLGCREKLVVGVSGNLTRPSKTKDIRRPHRRTGGEPRRCGLGRLRHRGSRPVLRVRQGVLAISIRRPATSSSNCSGADVLVVGSPTLQRQLYRAVQALLRLARPVIAAGQADHPRGHRRRRASFAHRRASAAAAVRLLRGADPADRASMPPTRTSPMARWCPRRSGPGPSRPLPRHAGVVGVARQRRAVAACNQSRRKPKPRRSRASTRSDTAMTRARKTDMQAETDQTGRLPARRRTAYRRLAPSRPAGRRRDQFRVPQASWR